MNFTTVNNPLYLNGRKGKKKRKQRVNFGKATNPLESPSLVGEDLEGNSVQKDPTRKEYLVPYTDRSRDREVSSSVSAPPEKPVVIPSQTSTTRLFSNIGPQNLGMV